MKRNEIILSAALLLACLLTFGGALKHEFVHFDDNIYITDNPRVHEGLTWEGVRWAFTTRFDANWFPLTLISHMLDGTLYGLNPAGHHFTSLLLHAFNTVLVFLILFRMTGALGASAAAALLFAVHPLRVESVAWVSERKDVLCAFFGLLTLLAYERYIRRQRWSTYILMLFFFALGLMSKPMLVTWPFVMLLLDYWPLERWRSRPWPKLVLEKIPLFVLIAASSYVTFRVQQAGGAVQSFDLYPLHIRVGNALIAYVEYLRLFFWPVDLAFYYPHPGLALSWGRAFFSACVLAAVTATVLWRLRKNPEWAVGWFWFLGMLVPVIGVIQVGAQSHADRYTYLPHIGLIWALVWAVRTCVTAWSPRGIIRTVYGAAAIGLVLLLAVLAHRQTATWRDSESLFLHAIRVTENNAIAHHNLGALYATQGRLDEAMPHLRRSIEIKPDYTDAHHSIGNVYMMRGQSADAIRHYREAVHLKPNHWIALNNLALLLTSTRPLAEADAREALNLALRIVEIPGARQAATLNTLATAYAANDRYAEAVAVTTEAHALALATGQHELATRLKGRLDLYQRKLLNRSPDAHAEP